MSRAKWFLAALIALTGLSVAVPSLGTLLSLDWSRAHTQDVTTLPVFERFGTPAVVTVEARGRTFRARISGSEGPGVMLLHGFPATSAAWEPLLERAEAEGFRIVAFDQRGYSPGARPEDLEDYVLSELVADVLAVADATGLERFHLVGHDWGSAVGWTVAGAAPERVLSWTGMSIAHPVAFDEALDSDPDQAERSSYFFVFTTPWLPEVLFAWGGMNGLKQVHAPATQAQRDEYLRVLSEPGAMTAALNWYRALDLSRAQAVKPTPRHASPTLFIWGNKDPNVGRVAVGLQTKYIDAPYEELELSAGHWLVEEQPEVVGDAIFAHMRRYSEPDGEDPGTIH